MIVFKYGGNAIPKNGTQDQVVDFLSEVIKQGTAIVLIHGGGPQVDKELEIHGIATETIDGYRVTDSDTFEVVQRTLSGEVLRNLTSQFIRNGINAVGISSADGGIIRAQVMKSNLGLVGEVKTVDPELLKILLKSGYTPIISPVGISALGVGLNLNADLVAGAIGGALDCECVFFSTNVEGIFRNWPDADSLIKEISFSELQSIAPSFTEGMVPKVQAVLNAIEAGAHSARIFDGRNVENVKMALSGAIGTLVTK